MFRVSLPFFIILLSGNSWNGPCDMLRWSRSKQLRGVLGPKTWTILRILRQELGGQPSNGAFKDGFVAIKNCTIRNGCEEAVSYHWRLTGIETTLPADPVLAASTWTSTEVPTQHPSVHNNLFRQMDSWSSLPVYLNGIRNDFYVK